MLLTCYVKLFNGIQNRMSIMKHKKRVRKETDPRMQTVSLSILRNSLKMNSHSWTHGDCHVDIGLDAKESCNRFLRIEIVSGSPETQCANYHPAGNEASGANYIIKNMDSRKVLRVNTLHVNSFVVGAKSKYISKLFSNSTEVSDQESVTIRIKDSEEAAFMEVLDFMHSDTLSSTTAPELLNLLMVANKFEVDLCIKYCTILLSNIPMTTEIALLYLDFLPQISLAKEVQPLIDTAKLFLSSRYKNIIMFEGELMGFPLSGIETILSADDLQVTSEDDVFDFVLKWSNAHYPKLEERTDIISSHLSKYIRFPYMSSHRLVEVLKCTDLDKYLAFKSVHNALVSKLDVLLVKASFLQNFTRIQDNDSSGGPTNTKCE